LKRDKTNAFGPKFWVITENILLRSRILFQKWTYSIFFGQKQQNESLRSWEKVSLMLLVHIPYKLKWRLIDIVKNFYGLELFFHKLSIFICCFLPATLFRDAFNTFSIDLYSS
jgi:hypothetical protein